MEKLGYEVQFPVKKKSALLESKRIVFLNNSKEFIKNQDIRIFKYIKKKNRIKHILILSSKYYNTSNISCAYLSTLFTDKFKFFIKFHTNAYGLIKKFSSRGNEILIAEN